jgi:tRNA A37 methylthiotransferase MiaB
MKKKFKIHTLGCRINQYESQAYVRQFNQLGYVEAKVDGDLADAIINGKNTCPSMHVVLQSGSNVVLKKHLRTNQIVIAQLTENTPDGLIGGVK